MPLPLDNPGEVRRGVRRQRRRGHRYRRSGVIGLLKYDIFDDNCEKITNNL